jgi:hypothetical protein
MGEADGSGGWVGQVAAVGVHGGADINLARRTDTNRRNKRNR